MNNNLLSNSNALDLLKEMTSEHKRLHASDVDYLASEYFDLDCIKSIIENPRCKGIRIYNGIKTDDNKKQVRLLIAGVDEKGKIILQLNKNLTNASALGLGFGIGIWATAAAIAENGQPCPPFCPPGL